MVPHPFVIGHKCAKGSHKALGTERYRLSRLRNGVIRKHACLISKRLRVQIPFPPPLRSKMKVRELREYLEQYDDYDVWISNYSSYSPAEMYDIEPCLLHDRQVFIPANCNSVM